MSDIDAAETGGRGGGRRWLGLALVASICLNLLLAGLIAGAWMRMGELAGAPRDGLVARIFPERYHAEARALMAEARESRRESSARTDEIHARILRLLRTEPYDAAALAAALEERRAVRYEAGSALSETVLAIAARMTPAERAELADRIETQIARWEKRRRED